MSEKLARNLEATAIATLVIAAATSPFYMSENNQPKSRTSEEYIAPVINLHDKIPHYAGALLVYKEKSVRPDLLIINPVAVPKRGVKNPNPQNTKDWSYSYAANGGLESDPIDAKPVLTQVPENLKLQLQPIPNESGDIEATSLQSFNMNDPNSGSQDSKSFKRSFTNVGKMLPSAFSKKYHISGKAEGSDTQTLADIADVATVVLYDSSETVKTFPERMIATPIEFIYPSGIEPNTDAITAATTHVVAIK